MIFFTIKSIFQSQKTINSIEQPMIEFPTLNQVHAPVHLHPQDKMIRQHNLVLWSVQCVHAQDFGEKIESSPVHLPIEAPPHPP